MALRDSGQRLFEIDLINAEQFRGNAGEKLSAFNAGILQGAALIRIERVHLLADHRPHTLRRHEIHF